MKCFITLEHSVREFTACFCCFHSMLMSWEWQWTFSFRIEHLYPYIASASVCIFRFFATTLILRQAFVPLFSTPRVGFYLTKMVSWLTDGWNVTIKQDSIPDGKHIHHSWQWKTMRNFRLVSGSQQCFHVMWFWWFCINWCIYIYIYIIYIYMCNYIFS